MGSPDFPTLDQQAKLRLYGEQTFAEGIQIKLTADHADFADNL